jgi:hypothetical protein
MRAIKAKTLKKRFSLKNLLSGSHCLHWLLSMVQKTLNYVVQLMTQKGCQTIEINDQELL